MLDLFIKNIKLDDANRIIVSVHDHMSEYLHQEESKKMVKDTLIKILGEDFIQLEIAKSSARVTVQEGRSEACKELIETEIKKAAEMAAAFMSQMNNQEQ